LETLPGGQINAQDVPEQRYWKNARRGEFYRPIKQQITLCVDADLIDWFRRHATPDEGYQASINRALREYVAHDDRD
jgi:uncharacterized protein (DUF4415 family)